MSTDLSKAHLRRANLYVANLSKAKLREAYLSGGANLVWADLREPDLSEADLIGSFLEGATFSGATGITNEELKQQSFKTTILQNNNPSKQQSLYTLEGATMPNGQKYEDWLKSEGRGEENSGAS